MDKNKIQQLSLTSNFNKSNNTNKLFIKYVGLEGYSLTGSTLDNRKIKVIFSTSFVDRILDKHMADIINFVRVKKL